MVDMRLRGRRMLAESYHPKRDYMNTSPTIGVLLAAGAILLPSCETERVNERPIGIYPTENVYPSGAVGAQGDSLLNDIQRENSLDPMAGQNSGFNPDPARTNSGTIGNMVGGATKIKILNRSTNKPYPSGTVLRDTNFPNEIKKFRVP